MNSNKLNILIFSLCLAIVLVLQSCEKKPLKTAKKQHNTVEIDKLLAAGYTHSDNVNFDSSYYYFNKAYYLAIREKDTSRILNSLSWKASSEMDKGEYFSCENTIIKALPLLKNTKKYSYGSWNVYSTLAINYMFLFDYRNAIQYHTKALKLKVDQFHKSKSLNNIAFVYMEKQEYQKAIQILLPLTFQKQIINDPIEFARIIENLGYCFFKIKDSRAFYYLNKALIINTKNKYEWGLITSYSRLAEFYLEYNPRLAYKYSRLAYEKATKIKDVNDRLISLTSLIKSSKGEETKKYALDYIRINDSNNKAKQIAKNQFAKIKYDSKNEREENQKLKVEKVENEIHLEQQKNRVLLLFFFITTGIIATLGIVNYLYLKNKKDKVKTTIETENRISKKLHDEVANDLLQTIAFTETQDLSSKQNKEILLTNLDAIYSKTRNILKENGIIETKLHFVDGLNEMISSFNTDAVTILTNSMDLVNWNALETHKKIIVYRVLQELLVNMKKHSQCSLAVLTFNKNENKLQIDYSDNGVGADFDEINSINGLQNVKNRILSINGTFTFDAKPNKGFKISFTVPI